MTTSRAVTGKPRSKPSHRSRLEGVKREIRAVIRDPATAIEIVEVALSLTPTHTRVHEVLRAALAADAIEELLVGDVDQLSNDLLAQARIAGEAKRVLLRDDELLTATQVSRLLGSRSENPRQYANKRRARGEILGVPRKNQFVYPTFQFDRKRKTVYPEIVTVGKLLRSNADPWGTLSWWVTPNARLADERAPRDLLGTTSSLTIVSLAQAVVEPVG